MYLFQGQFHSGGYILPRLSYEEIEENKAFEFLSLLSEIGGFLGLLLGASVLTVCELVDYITLVIIKNIGRNETKLRTSTKRNTLLFSDQ